MISNIADEYVYKKEVDWSLLMEGLTLPVENQVIFGQIAGRFLQQGMMQIRYPRNGELSHELQGCFLRSCSYLKSMRI